MKNEKLQMQRHSCERSEPFILHPSFFTYHLSHFTIHLFIIPCDICHYLETSS